MNKIKNSVTLVGRIGVDPISKTFENGVKQTKFPLATNETIIGPNGRITKTQWHNIVTWGNKADLVMKYVKKGQLMCIDGKIVYRTWTDESGVSRKITEVHANEVLLINPEKSKKPTTPNRVIQLKSEQKKVVRKAG